MVDDTIAHAISVLFIFTPGEILSCCCLYNRHCFASYKAGADQLMGCRGCIPPPPPSDIQHPLRKLWYCIRRLQLSLNGPIRNAIKSDVKLDLTDINFVCCKKRYVTSLKKNVENVIITTSCTDHVSG
jgi:hypothetical protein